MGRSTPPEPICARTMPGWPVPGRLAEETSTKQAAGGGVGLTIGPDMLPIPGLDVVAVHGPAAPTGAMAVIPLQVVCSELPEPDVLQDGAVTEDGVKLPDAPATGLAENASVGVGELIGPAYCIAPMNGTDELTFPNKPPSSTQGHLLVAVLETVSSSVTA